jgi:hypothetical protein
MIPRRSGHRSVAPCDQLSDFEPDRLKAKALAAVLAAGCIHGECYRSGQVWGMVAEEGT